MAAKPPSNQILPLDPEEELTTPEVRPALRSAQALADAPPFLPPGLELGPELTAARSAAIADDDEVTLVDPNRRRAINPENLPPPPDFPDLE
ncbi:MAG TPA: hypothetical protein PLW65_16500 [Pseudomonadota bacterium]|nr:hypothetical protein [Pseudomonadota bacterium]